MLIRRNLLKKNQKNSCDGGLNSQAIAFMAKTLGDENRTRIIQLLADDKKSVSSIVEELGISQPLTSHHLKELKRALLVTVERNGPFIFYKLTDNRITGILSNLSELATDLLKNRTLF
jgi:DNA-binding transcriptional ArsR family regulator